MTRKLKSKKKVTCAFSQLAIKDFYIIVTQKIFLLLIFLLLTSYYSTKIAILKLSFYRDRTILRLRSTHVFTPRVLAKLYIFSFFRVRRIFSLSDTDLVEKSIFFFSH